MGTVKEKLIGTKVQVGSGGYIQLVDVLGSDHRVVNAARVSYNKHNEFGEQSDILADRNLLRYMMRNHHTSPFEQGEIVFLVRSPMDVWRQWIRHRTANVNEWSTRYTEAINDTAATAPDAWRLQDQSNRQGSSPDCLNEVDGYHLSENEKLLHERARDVYESRLEAGVAREQARKDLPLATYTEAYWKCDLHNIFGFLYLRLDTHAQLEIRQYANEMWSFVQALFPLSAEAFKDYRLDAITFTGPELTYMASQPWRGLGDMNLSEDNATQLGMTKRECEDFNGKLLQISSLQYS